MRSLAYHALVGAAFVAVTGAAKAADMPEPVYKAPEVEVVAAGWYLRGDIGISNQRVGSLGAIEYDENPTFVVHEKDFDAAAFFGLGVGYQFNDWLRADLTGEYRAKSKFTGFDTYGYPDEGPTPIAGSNEYDGDKTEWTFLVNVYVDLGNWYGFTPFVGAGVGTSRNTISNLTDYNEINDAFGYADDHSQWEFAWAIYAGVGYELMPGVTLEFAYRYLDLGSAASGNFYDASNGQLAGGPLYFNDLTSHDFKLGLRWALGGVGVAGAPVVSKY